MNFVLDVSVALLWLVPEYNAARVTLFALRLKRPY